MKALRLLAALYLVFGWTIIMAPSATATQAEYDALVAAAQQQIDTVQSNLTAAQNQLVLDQAAKTAADAAAATALTEMNTAQSNYDTQLIQQVTTTTEGITMDVYNNAMNRTRPDGTLCLSTTVSQIDADWGGGSVAGCNPEYVSIHYYGNFTVPQTDNYQFLNIADDGFYMTINGNVVIDEWVLKGCSGDWSQPIQLQAGVTYQLDAWFFEWGGGACSTLYYQNSTDGMTVVPASWFGSVQSVTTVQDPALLTILQNKQSAYASAAGTATSAGNTVTQTQNLISQLQQQLQEAQAALAAIPPYVAPPPPEPPAPPTPTPTIEPSPSPNPTPQPEPSSPTPPTEPSQPPVVTPPASNPTDYQPPAPPPEPPLAPTPEPTVEPTPTPDSTPSTPPDEESDSSSEQTPIDPIDTEPTEPSTEPQTPEEPEQPSTPPSKDEDSVLEPTTEDPETPQSQSPETDNQIDKTSEDTTPEEVDSVVKDALADGVLTDEEKAVVAEALIASAGGRPVSAADIQAAGLTYEDLPPQTPVEVRTDENGNEVVITAEVAAALVLLDNPAELLGAVFTDPGKALKALANIGADMSPQEREESQKTIVASVIVGQIAISAVGAATGAVQSGGASYRRNL